jgi:hypothetical protein
MDASEFLSFLLPTVGVSAGAVAWLTKSRVGHLRAREMEQRKADLARELELHKAQWAGEVKRQVENWLADKAADREYVLDARKRLYTAIGPLRFQLLLACRDLSGRVTAHARSPYDTDVEHYYGRSFLFRILRPLAISELIERQIAFADFAVDAGAQDLLRFKKAAFAAFTGAGQGTEIGFERRELQCANLLRVAGDAYIDANLDVFVRRCERLPESPL